MAQANSMWPTCTFTSRGVEGLGVGLGQLRKGVGWHGRAAQVALKLLATQGQQLRPLVFGFHTLGHGAQAQLRARVRMVSTITRSLGSWLMSATNERSILSLFAGKRLR